MALYRSLNIEEINRGCVLYPKSALPFKAHPRIPISLPFYLGERKEHAVREHQWCGEYKTSGVSCTKELAIAKTKYFGEGVIVEIDEEKIKLHGIKKYVVKEWLDENMIEFPEDEEVILVYEGGHEFPKDILKVIINEK